MTIEENIIIALDVSTEDEARKIVKLVGARAKLYKIGLQFLTSSGPGIIHALTAAGKGVFLDLKLFEIPNSVGSAVKAAGLHGVQMVTVHALGGLDILRAAVKAAEPFPEMKVLALTVVTSLQDADLKQVGIQSTVDEQVVRLAQLADIAGCHGVVASAREAKLLKGKIRTDMSIVTPGIQLEGDAGTDQVRVTTPRNAFEAGATHIVIGRSITKTENPSAVFDRICMELGSIQRPASEGSPNGVVTLGRA